MQSNGQPLKSWEFCRVHWALNSGFKGLSTDFMSKGTTTSQAGFEEGFEVFMK